MEDCMIEEPCRACSRVWCNCPPEPEDDFDLDEYLDFLSLCDSDPGPLV